MGKVVTVTREFGSMGRLIAKKVASELGFQYYDREMLDIVAKEFRGNIDELVSFDDKQISSLGKMLYPLGLGSAKKQAQVFEMEKSVMIDLANSDKDCVIVGRCSDYVLRSIGHKSMLNVFIYAPYEAKIDFCQRELYLEEHEAAFMIKGVDKARSEFYKLNTGESFWSNKYRNLMLDSSIMSHEACADLIVKAAKQKFRI